MFYLLDCIIKIINEQIETDYYDLEDDEPQRTLNMITANLAIMSSLQMVGQFVESVESMDTFILKII